MRSIKVWDNSNISSTSLLDMSDCYSVEYSPVWGVLAHELLHNELPSQVWSHCPIKNLVMHLQDAKDGGGAGPSRLSHVSTHNCTFARRQVALRARRPQTVTRVAVTLSDLISSSSSNSQSSRTKSAPPSLMSDRRSASSPGSSTNCIDSLHANHIFSLTSDLFAFRIHIRQTLWPRPLAWFSEAWVW